jgi:hypothetical protein
MSKVFRGGSALFVLIGTYDLGSVQGRNLDQGERPTHAPFRGNPTLLKEPFGADRRKCLLFVAQSSLGEN